MGHVQNDRADARGRTGENSSSEKEGGSELDALRGCVCMCVCVCVCVREREGGGGVVRWLLNVPAI